MTRKIQVVLFRKGRAIQQERTWVRTRPSSTKISIQKHQYHPIKPVIISSYQPKTADKLYSCKAVVLHLQVTPRQKTETKHLHRDHTSCQLDETKQMCSKHGVRVLAW